MGRTVAVVGATGAVGEDLRRLLDSRDFPLDEIVFVASARSAGRRITFGDTEVVVRDAATDGIFDGVDLALFSAGGGTSRELAPVAVDAGAVVVDNSSAWRMDPEVPLVVLEVNADALESIPKGIVANPNCVAMAILLPLKALHDAFGLTGFTATSFQAAGGAGQSGIDELMEQIPVLGADPEALRRDGAGMMEKVTASVHAAPLAFNVVPWLGTPEPGGYTDEEMKLVFESRKILGLPDLAIAPTCVRVPVVAGHSVQLRANFADQVDVERAHAVLDAFPGIVMDPIPTPLTWAGRNEVAVGRLRADLNDPHALNLFVVGDNLLKGAALNTVQIAEELVARGVV